MTRFTLSKLFTPWTAASTAPAKPGWYRVRTEPLTHSWWSGMAYFDGQGWFEFGNHAGLGVRRQLDVLQWQGLNCPVAEAVRTVQANMPRTLRARRSYERFLAGFGAPAGVPA